MPTEYDAYLRKGDYEYIFELILLVAISVSFGIAVGYGLSPTVYPHHMSCVSSWSANVLTIICK